MTVEEMKFAGVIAWTLVLTVLTVSMVGTPSYWFLVVMAGSLLPLMIALAWRPAMQAVRARVRETPR